MTEFHEFGANDEKRDVDPEKSEYSKDPNEGNALAEADEVLVDNPAKAAHEDQVPATQKEADANETRDGSDFEAGKTQRELRDEREDEAKSDKD